MDLLTVPVKLPSGRTLAVEVAARDGRQPVAVLDALRFDDVIATAREIAELMGNVVESASPHEATVEFGVDVTLESGQLTTLLVKGSGTATLKVSLKWTQDGQDPPTHRR